MFVCYVYTNIEICNKFTYFNHKTSVHSHNKASHAQSTNRCHQKLFLNSLTYLKSATNGTHNSHKFQTMFSN